MKRLLLIVLVVCMLGIVFTDIVSAKATFGSWKKWDEALAPWDNKGWDWESCRSTFIGFPYIRDTLLWLWADEKWYFLKVNGQESTDNAFFLLTRLSFIKDKKHQASIILFSPASIGKDIEGIKCIKSGLDNAEFAIVAFPPNREEVVIRVYENENGLFRFLEEWTVVFKNKTIIIPEKTIKFSQKYGDFISEFQQLREQNITVSPLLIVLDGKKKEFCLGVALEIFDGKKTIRPIF